MPTFENLRFDNDALLALFAQMQRNQQSRESNTVSQVANIADNLNRRFAQGRAQEFQAGQAQKERLFESEQDRIARDASGDEAELARRGRMNVAEAQIRGRTDVADTRATSDAADLLQRQTKERNLQAQRKGDTARKSFEFDATQRDRAAGRDIQRGNLALKERQQRAVQDEAGRAAKLNERKLKVLEGNAQRLGNAQTFKQRTAARRESVTIMGQLRGQIAASEAALSRIGANDRLLDPTASARAARHENDIAETREQLRALEVRFDASLGTPAGVRNALRVALDSGASPAQAARELMGLVQDGDLAHIAEWLSRLEAEQKGAAMGTLVEIAASARQR